MLTHKSCPDLALLPKLRSSGGGFHISVMRRRIPDEFKPNITSADGLVRRLPHKTLGFGSATSRQLRAVARVH
jgi:hypothetical protein